MFQRLRRLTRRLNPTNDSEPKATLTIDEDLIRPFKKARELKFMPTDESLRDVDNWVPLWFCLMFFVPVENYLHWRISFAEADV